MRCYKNGERLVHCFADSVNFISNEQTFLKDGDTQQDNTDDSSEPVGPFGVPLSKLYSYTMLACLIALIQLVFMMLICCYVKYLRAN